MFDVLNVEDDAERDKRENGGPETKIASPDIFVVFDL
jgi:hypothetical protein